MAAISKFLQSLSIGSIRTYQYLFSPWLGKACRFEPTCSQYAIDAVKMHGCFKGCRLALMRILRCHPWHPGGVDPVK